MGPIVTTPNETRLAKYLYIFFLSKIYEFFDTFIMLLKGNINQISFLHVYHTRQYPSYGG